MFQKGPQPGYSPKTEALKKNPNLVCRRVGGDYGSGVIWGYAVFDGEKELACRGNAFQAWEEALSKLS